MQGASVNNCWVVQLRRVRASQGGGANNMPSCRKTACTKPEGWRAGTKCSRCECSALCITCLVYASARSWLQGMLHHSLTTRPLDAMSPEPQGTPSWPARPSQRLPAPHCWKLCARGPSAAPHPHTCSRKVSSAPLPLMMSDIWLCWVQLDQQQAASWKTLLQQCKL